MNLPLHFRSGAVRRWLPAIGAWVMMFCAASAYGGGAAVYTLDDCLRLAAAQNPEVLVAAKRIDGAKGLVTQARAGIFPTLAANGFYQRREQGLASSGGLNQGLRKDDYTGDIRLSQLIFSSFSVRNRIAVAHLNERIVTLGYRTALNVVGAQVREAFNTTLAAEAGIRVRQSAIDLLEAQLKDQQDRLAAGSVGQLNVNRAQVALANEQPALLEARAGVRTAYAALAQLLGIAYEPGTVEAPFRVRGALEVRPFDLPVEECIRRALAQRPEVEVGNLALELLKHQLVVEKAGTRPAVSLFAAYDVYSEPVIAADQDRFSGYTLGIGASWTIFDGFATLGRVRGVRAQQGEAAQQVRATRLAVETEVRNAYDALRTAEATLRPQSQNIALANETLNLSTRNLAAGLATQLDVLQTRVDLTRAETQELGARLGFNVAFSRLERAMASNVPTPAGVTKTTAPATAPGPLPAK